MFEGGAVAGSSVSLGPEGSKFTEGTLKGVTVKEIEGALVQVWCRFDGSARCS